VLHPCVMCLSCNFPPSLPRPGDTKAHRRDASAFYDIELSVVAWLAGTRKHEEARARLLDGQLLADVGRIRGMARNESSMYPPPSLGGLPCYINPEGSPCDASDSGLLKSRRKLVHDL